LVIRRISGLLKRKTVKDLLTKIYFTEQNLLTKKQKRSKLFKSKLCNSSSTRTQVAHASLLALPLYRHSLLRGRRERLRLQKKENTSKPNKKISFLYKKRRKETEWMFSCQAAFKIVDMNVSTWSLIASFKFGIAFDMMCIMFIVSALGVEDLPFSSIAAHFSPLFCIFSL